jgi:hypothetical protein
MKYIYASLFLCALFCTITVAIKEAHVPFGVAKSLAFALLALHWGVSFYVEQKK